jgi:hypothetical protein
MTETSLRDVLEKLEQTLTGLLLEVKGMRTHGDSAGYFLQIAVEDVHKTLQELKVAVLK